MIDCFFINAFRDNYKAQAILTEMRSLYKKKYHYRMGKLFSVLYENEPTSDGFDRVNFQIECWKLKCKHMEIRPFSVLVSATMSAGKSTLINALIGKTVNRTMNDACTAKLHFIFDKAFA
ncbi:MAG TPA: hypothetical protein VIL05_00005 [Thermoclostridium sp.]